ncbi:MAG: hypothetical protein DCC75_11410 [Proteobacteria bacterium]|nr:MAG: hypothetical protein DCC75_11410 [Pseudomonadota bacterium]
MPQEGCWARSPAIVYRHQLNLWLENRSWLDEARAGRLALGSEQVQDLRRVEEELGRSLRLALELHRAAGIEEMEKVIQEWERVDLEKAKAIPQAVA